MSKQEKFKELLKTIFQYNKEKIDLDFGVYRVFKHKEDEIRSFIETNLPEFIEVNLDSLEPTSIYNHTLEFFERYFRDGDFYPVPIYSTTKNHVLRHNGEEVIFSWANKDQYYIKSIDNFSVYKIKHDKLYDDSFYNTSTQAVNFVVNEIDDTKGNNKSTRIFTLSSKDPEFLENEGFNIYINYKNKSADIVEIDENKLYEITQNAKINLTFEEVAHHLRKFKNLRKTDFFIHKKLEAFLKEELDYYLKTNILRDITTLSEIDIKTTQVVKKVGEFIIKFIASLEELQKMLWEKKKFAYDVNYIITLDKLSKELLEEIVNRTNFQKQLVEWRELNLINVFNKDELYDGLLGELKKEYEYLPLDTKHFDEGLKYKILESIENIDEATDGVLINSDNFHGLNFLQNRYREKVKCVYIDPPYNTGSDGFAYKDNYQHSSWLSMMSDRLEVTKGLISENGVIFTNIDNNESSSLNNLFNNSQFYFIDKVSLQVKAQSGESSKFETPFTDLKEEIFYCAKNENYDFNEIDVTKEHITEESKTMEQYKYEVRNLGRKSKSIKFSFRIDKGKTTIDVYELEDFDWKIISKDNRNEEYYFNNIDKITRTASFSGEFKTQFSKRKNTNYYFEYLITRGKNKGKLAQIRIVNGEQLIYLKDYTKKIEDNGKNRLVKLEKLSNIWQDISYTGIAKEGRVELKNGKKPENLIERIIKLSSNTDDNDYILDYFAGSGTTPAVAHKLNKKYLAIEMGEYFDNLILKRMKYTLFGDSGGIKSKNSGGIIKYYRLEQYEDTLENSKLQSSTDMDSYIKALEPLKEHMSELYASKYLFLYKDFTARESKALLMDDSIYFRPFDFTMKVNIDSQMVEKKMDLVETFNTLKGIEVQSIKLRYFETKKYIFIDGKNEVVIWREFDKESLDIQKELEFINDNCDLSKELYINGITQTHTKKELVAKESVFELRALLVEGVKIDE